MKFTSLPPLPLSQWRPTRDALHAYCRVLGKIRRSLTPPEKHWWHTSLRVQLNGLSTSAIPIPGQEGDTVEMWIDLVDHLLVVQTAGKEVGKMELEGLSTSQFLEACLSSLARWDIRPEIDHTLFQDPNPKVYDRTAAGDFWNALARIDHLLQQFKADLPGETSPVQFWPHNFDLALMWLSGRKIPGFDPEDEELSDEQIAFGFSTGDAGTPDAYLYVTVYPWPEDLVEAPLPEDAVWHTQGWKGALLPYASLILSNEPEARLLEFLRAVYRTGSTHLR